MPFTVEDGTGLADANAYASVAFVDDYHTIRGNTKWQGSDGLKQACIIRATDYVDQRFAELFRGCRGSDGQGLEWPRYDAWSDENYAIDGVPLNLKRAIAEYALRALLLGNLAPDPSSLSPSQSMVSGVANGTSAAGGSVAAVRKVLGPLEIETRYTKPGETRQFSQSGIVSGQSLPEYPTADMYLTKLIVSQSSLEVVRG